MSTYNDLADLIFADATLSTTSEIEAKYRPRALPEGAFVTRFAPSPTGFLHLGGIYASLISERLAHQSNGVFFLRIEDTDKKREVDGAISIITNSLQKYGITFDEGQISLNNEVGDYGPYTQSDRELIYKSYIKNLISKNLAYPCFATEEELKEMVEIQSSAKEPLGYYGKWAVWANKSVDEYIAEVKTKKPFVIRIRSTGDAYKYIKVSDLFKGNLSLPENNQDIVILKSNGLPTYHFAHLIDDHLMGTTHVLRGDEWLSSLTLHIQLFNLMGWNVPVYGHIAPIQKMDGNSRRKLSKRKDPEANIEFYTIEGYAVEALKSYLLNLANSGFENWRKQNLTLNINDYKLSISELKKGAGSLLDMVKLNDISKDFIATLTKEEVYSRVLDWSKEFDTELHMLLTKYPLYSKEMFGIERSLGKPRKDIIKWSDVKFQFSFFFDELFENKKEDINLLSNIDLETINKISDSVLKVYNPQDSKDEWLLKTREIAESFGYTSNNKLFKEDPTNFKGQFGDFAMILRVLLTGRTQCPDLYEMLKVMGVDRVEKRLKRLG